MSLTDLTRGTLPRGHRNLPQSSPCSSSAHSAWNMVSFPFLASCSLQKEPAPMSLPCRVPRASRSPRILSRGSLGWLFHTALSWFVSISTFSTKLNVGRIYAFYLCAQVPGTGSDMSEVLIHVCWLRKWKNVTSLASITYFSFCSGHFNSGLQPRASVWMEWTELVVIKFTPSCDPPVIYPFLRITVLNISCWQVFCQSLRIKRWPGQIPF